MKKILLSAVVLVTMTGAAMAQTHKPKPVHHKHHHYHHHHVKHHK